MTRKVRFFSIFQQIVLVFALTVPSPGFSGDVTVGPGKFDHFRVSLPEKIKAGEEGVVRLEAVDAVNNVIQNFGENDWEFRVAVSGSARVTPDAFKASSFVKGSFTFTIIDKTAETMTLSIKENNRFMPVLSQDVEILPNQLGHFLIQGPHTVQAGERFDLTVIGKDSFGNTVQEPISGGNIDLRFKGDAEPQMEKSSISDFKSGATTITFTSKKAGTVIVEVKDLITGSTGTSGTIKITHGPVSAFKLWTPKEVIAGELFEATLVVVDRFDNQVLNYASSGNGVQIATSGRQKPFPSTIPASAFSNGEAKIDLRYNSPEDMTLSVQEIGDVQKGKSDVIRVAPAVPARIDVVTPESAIAGQKFKIKMTVYNQIGHEIKHYNLFGPDVLLSATGSGVLTPARVPASEFVNGTAVVEVHYDKSESFTISASPASVSRTEARRADKKALPVFPTGTAPVQKVVAARNGTQGEAPTRGESNEVSDISLDEPLDRSIVTIHFVPGDKLLKYSVATEVSGGSKWIVLKLKPAITRLVSPLRFESSFIRQIQVTEDQRERGALWVKIEEIKSSRFRVKKEKDFITITLRR